MTQSLPLDIVGIVAEFFTPRDLIPLLFVCKAFHHLLEPYLYHSLQLPAHRLPPTSARLLRKTRVCRLVSTDGLHTYSITPDLLHGLFTHVASLRELWLDGKHGPIVVDWALVASHCKRLRVVSFTACSLVDFSMVRFHHLRRFECVRMPPMESKQEEMDMWKRLGDMYAHQLTEVQVVDSTPSTESVQFMFAHFAGRCVHLTTFVFRNAGPFSYRREVAAQGLVQTMMNSSSTLTYLCGNDCDRLDTAFWHAVAQCQQLCVLELSSRMWTAPEDFDVLHAALQGLVHLKHLALCDGWPSHFNWAFVVTLLNNLGHPNRLTTLLLEGVSSLDSGWNDMKEWTRQQRNEWWFVHGTIQFKSHGYARGFLEWTAHANQVHVV